MEQIVDGLCASRNFYQRMLKPVCDRYGLTSAEMNVLMYLSENPEENTSRDIGEKMQMKKSIVSISLKDLQQRNLIRSEYTDGNRRSLHSFIEADALPIAEEGKKALAQYSDIVTRGFTKKEKENFVEILEKIKENISAFSLMEEGAYED